MKKYWIVLVALFCTVSIYLGIKASSAPDHNMDLLVQNVEALALAEDALPGSNWVQERISTGRCVSCRSGGSETCCL